MHAVLFPLSTWLAAQAAEAPQGAEGGGLAALSPMLMIVLMFGVVYFLMIRPQSKQQKEHQGFLSTLQKGSEVVTSGGMVGRIHSVGADTVVVEVAKDVRVTLLKNYVFPHRPAAAPAPDGKDSKETPKDEAKK